MRVFACACLILTLSACGGRSSDAKVTSGTSTSGQTTIGQQLGKVDAGNDTTGLVSDQSGNAGSAGDSAGTSTSGTSAGAAGMDTSGDPSAGGTTSSGGTTGGFDLPGPTAGLLPQPNDTSGASDGGSTDGNTDGVTPIGTGSGPVFADSARPQAIRLQTFEEVSIDGEFELLGESSGLEFPEQSFSIIKPPSNGTLFHSEPERQFTYAPEEDFFGEDTFTYSIGPGLAARVTIEVTDVNDPPVLSDDLPRVIEQDTAFTGLLNATDPDNESLSYFASNLPSWLSLDESTGLLSGTPTQADVGLFESISFTVADGAGQSSTIDDISIEVIDINDAPTINVDQFPDRLDASELVSVNLYPDDPDGDLVQVLVEQNDFLDINVVGSTVNVLATEVPEVTDVNLVVEAKDLRGRVAREIIPLTIYPINSTGRGRTIRGRSSGEGIHLIVLGDGYREDQQKQFRLDVEALIKKMQGDIGMLTHFSAWNVHMVETPSTDSGIDDNNGSDIRDTVFNTGYFCRGVQRLICGNQSKMYEVAIDEYPNFDQIVVLVNDDRYGGSGGNVAISSSDSLEIALHEMGHSIAGLADEYVDSYIPESSIPNYVEGRYPNVSSSSDPTVVPWKHWIVSDTSSTIVDAPSGVGIFEGAFYRPTGFYRPTRNSLMRSYDGVLGPVNGEQWALSVYSMSNPVLDLSPVTNSVSLLDGDVAEFYVVPLFDPTLQLVEWRLDSELIEHSGGKRPTVELDLPVGNYELTVKVSDSSGLIRKPGPHAGIFEWGWSITVE